MNQYALNNLMTYGYQIFPKHYLILNLQKVIESNVQFSVNKHYVCDIILYNNDITMDTINFIKTLENKFRKVIIHSYVMINYKPLNVNILREVFSKHINLKHIREYNPETKVMTKEWNWLRFEKGFQPIKCSQITLGHIIDIWLDVEFNQQFKLAYPRLRYKVHYPYPYIQHLPFVNMDYNFLRNKEETIKELAVMEFKEVNPSMLGAFKSDDEIWEFLTRRGEWDVSENNHGFKHDDMNSVKNILHEIYAAVSKS